MGEKWPGQLEASEKEGEEYISVMYSDPKTGENVPDIEQLIRPEDPEQDFDEAPPKLKEVVDVNNNNKKGRAVSIITRSKMEYHIKYTRTARELQDAYGNCKVSYGEEVDLQRVGTRLRGALYQRNRSQRH